MKASELTPQLIIGPTATQSPLHAPLMHESGLHHTSGEARYIDDLLPARDLLFGLPVTSPHAHARIVRRDAKEARQVPGIAAILFADDIPGMNDASPVVHDEELLATDYVHCVGQNVALIVGASEVACRAALAKMVIEYEPLTPILNIPDAIAANSFLWDPQIIARGDVDAALQNATWRIKGEVETPGQDHFYLETQVAEAKPLENGNFFILSSTQHPSEVQAKVAEALGVGRHRIVVECPRVGGGFGGKETQAAPIAQLAAVAAFHTNRPVRIRLHREQDMQNTGKRHPWLSYYEAGFDQDGRFTALRVHTYSNGGFSTDLSRAVTQRCLFHLDNAYYIPNAYFEGRIARTNLPSNTAFRGFGGPQGVAVVDCIINRAAELMDKDPAVLREKNFYADAPRDVTPYGQQVTHNRLPELWNPLLQTSNYFERRRAIDAFNAQSKFVRRGIGVQPVKFGISFTTNFLNQAGALVLIYADGTVQLNHGGIEMGQGLHTKMLAICAHELGISPQAIRVMATSTDKVPNTSATAASSGSDLNGQAVRQACETLRERLKPIASDVLKKARASQAPSNLPSKRERTRTHSIEDIIFEGNVVFAQSNPSVKVTFAEVASAAYNAQVSLSATGYYKTPNIHFDAATGKGHPFHYYAYGAAVVEVELSSLTGEYRLLRVDILHDAGNSLVPTIDKGQVEGGFIQGVGWITVEELVLNDKGQFLTVGPSTYKIPSFGDAPVHFNVDLLKEAPQPDVIHGSKAVGEPPFMLGIGAITALHHAIASFGPRGRPVALALPATPEAVLRAIVASQNLNP